MDRNESNEEKLARLDTNFNSRLYLIGEDMPETIFPDAEKLIEKTMQRLTGIEARIIRSNMRQVSNPETILEFQNQIAYAWDSLSLALDLMPALKKQFELD